MKKFALTGVAGFVAPRHLIAIKETNNILCATLDPHDSVGILDNYFPTARFFTQTELFEQYIEAEQLGAKCEEDRISYLSICSPNYLHDSHIRMALRMGANAICEKPLTIDPGNLSQLQDLEIKTGCRVYAILQLRLHPALITLKNTLLKNPLRDKAKVCLTYVTRRGFWYRSSWKSDFNKSGGLAMNIGIHFFDILIWLFGSVEKSKLYISQPTRASGVLELEKATIQWFLSINETDLPEHCIEKGQYSYRLISINGEEVEFSDGFTRLHTKAYERILLGEGHGIEDAMQALSLVDLINKSSTSIIGSDSHPFLLSE